MKLVVPLTIPWTRSMCAAASVSDITRIAGTTPATAPSKRSWTLFARAASKISSPNWESSCLLAVTTWRPAPSARSTYSRAGSVPPISSTTRSLRSSRSAKSPRLRVSTPATSGRRPVSAAMASARDSSSSWKAAPTVPCPRSATRNGPSEVTKRQIVEGLAPHHEPGVAVAAEHDRRAAQRVVVVRHRVPVGAGGRHDEEVAGARVVERHVADQDVPRLAVHSGDGADLVAAEAADDLGLVARVVEHGPQVVRHPAVHRHPGAHSLHALDGAHAVNRHAGVAHERAARLAEHGHARRDVAEQRLDVGLDGRRLVARRVGDAEAAAEVEERPVAEARQHLRDRLEPLELEDLRADVRVQAANLEPRRAAALHRPLHVGEREPELRVGLSGLYVRVGARLDAGSDPDQHALRASRKPVDLVERVDHDVADAALAG